MANCELESQQVVDLLKQTMKDLFSELATLIPAQPDPHTDQSPKADPNVPGPSMVSAPLPPSGCTVRDSLLESSSEDSSEDLEPSGFSFSLVQPFIQASNDAIACKDPEEPLTK